VLTRKHILYGILVLLGLFADAYDVSAKPVSDGREINLVIVNGDSLSVEPGRIFTVVYKLTNDESDDRNLQPRMTLPDGWKLASALTPIHVSGGGSTVRFITFRIPTSSPGRKLTQPHSRSKMPQIGKELPPYPPSSASERCMVSNFLSTRFPNLSRQDAG